MRYEESKTAGDVTTFTEYEGTPDEIAELMRKKVDVKPINVHVDAEKVKESVQEVAKEVADGIKKNHPPR